MCEVLPEGEDLHRENEGGGCGFHMGHGRGLELTSPQEKSEVEVSHHRGEGIGGGGWVAGMVVCPYRNRRWGVSCYKEDGKAEGLCRLKN